MSLRHLLPLILLAPLALAQPPQATYTPGDTRLPAREAATSCGHVIPALTDYLAARMQQPEGDSTTFYRHRALDTIRRYSREVNDSLLRPDGSWATPLSLAVQAQDADLVRLLLGLEALPLAPKAGAGLAALPPAPGVPQDPRVAELLRHALDQCNPLEYALQGRCAGALDSRQRRLDEKPWTCQQRLEGVHRAPIEGIFEGEPGMSGPEAYQTYHAYNRLDAPHRVMLRLQPIHRSFTPAPEKNGRPCGMALITTTARVVEVVKGKPLAQGCVRYVTPHEGNQYQGATGELGAGEEQYLLFTSVKDMAAARVEGDLLDFGFIDWTLCRPARHWDKAVANAFRICPELHESTPARELERVLAHALLAKHATLVRATITRRDMEPDEAGGEVRVRYAAELRPPLQSGTIQGHTPHERALSYERRFPLTADWRARLAGAGQGGPVPAILALETDAAGRARVIEAWDAENDEALLRALNEITIQTSFRASMP